MLDITVCPLCSAIAVLDNNALMWVCPTHPSMKVSNKEGKPMGNLADHRTRGFRVKAHKLLDELCDKSSMSKAQMYRWLGLKMGTDKKDTHFALFDQGQCKKAIRYLTEELMRSDLRLMDCNVHKSGKYMSIKITMSENEYSCRLQAGATTSEVVYKLEQLIGGIKEND